jgi:hypothetical protein
MGVHVVVHILRVDANHSEAAAEKTANKEGGHAFALTLWTWLSVGLDWR